MRCQPVDVGLEGFGCLLLSLGRGNRCTDGLKGIAEAIGQVTHLGLECSRVEVVVVTMPGTFLLASYRKSENAASLVARFIHDYRHAAIPRSEFVARSWRLALTKARQFGWIE